MTTAEQSAGNPASPPDRAGRPANLVGAVVAELVDRIVRGLHPPGSPLPTEPALCQAFYVSRTVVREAMKLLQQKGLVQVRQGSGTTVTPRATWNILDELVLAATIAHDEDLAILDDLVVSRRLLEADMAHVTARLASPDILERLRALVDQMDELVDDHATYVEHDRAFHDLIMLTSGNRIGRAFVRLLESQVITTDRYMGQPERDLCVASNRGHRKVYERIAAHDPAGAADAMYTHITEAWVARRSGPADPEGLRR